MSRAQVVVVFPSSNGSFGGEGMDPTTYLYDDFRVSGGGSKGNRAAAAILGGHPLEMNS